MRARIRAGLDHSGEPALFIDAEYRLSEEPLDVRATFGLVTLVREALEAIDETRFPYVRHRFHEDQRSTDDK